MCTIYDQADISTNTKEFRYRKMVHSYQRKCKAQNGGIKSRLQRNRANRQIVKLEAPVAIETVFRDVLRTAHEDGPAILVMI